MVVHDQNSAKVSFVDADGGVDSSTFKKIRITSLSASPIIQDIYASNIRAVCGKDSLYEVTFWAKMGYSSARPTKLTRQIYIYDYSVTSYRSNLGTYVR